jgi:hypothetical protein
MGRTVGPPGGRGPAVRRVTKSYEDHVRCIGDAIEAADADFYLDVTADENHTSPGSAGSSAG